MKSKQKFHPSKSSNSGFTIIESLLAILVVAILLTAIAPVIVLATATRVQSRRVEVATQQAKAYIEGVRAGTLPAPTATYAIPLEYNSTATPKFTTPNRATFPDFPAPTAITDPKLYCVNLDGGATCQNPQSYKNFIIQAVRGALAAGTPDQGYLLFVRVYRTDAFADGQPLVTQKQRGSKQSVVTGGLGDRKAPLVEIVTEISTSKTSYTDYCARIGCQ